MPAAMIAETASTGDAESIEVRQHRSHRARQRR